MKEHSWCLGMIVYTLLMALLALILASFPDFLTTFVPAISYGSNCNIVTFRSTEKFWQNSVWQREKKAVREVAEGSSTACFAVS